MKIINKLITICVIFSISLPLSAQNETNDLLTKGKEIFEGSNSCQLCHGNDARGISGPSLHYGPTPYDIHYQLNTNPLMGPLNAELTPTNEDLLALSLYIQTLAGNTPNQEKISQFRSTLNSIRDYTAITDYVITERDEVINKIQRFKTVQDDWQQRSKQGNIKKDYQMEVVATFEPGEAKFTPEPGKTYFYENAGAAQSGSPATPVSSINRESIDLNQIIVGDAQTKEIIASYVLPLELKSSMHTTAATPDGKHVYIIGARPFSKDPGGDGMNLSSPSTLLKVDALTLQPVKQLSMGGRMHHMQMFGDDKHMLVDTFARDANGLDVFLMDPETDTIVGGVRDEELGGVTYTSFNDGESIYILMQPHGYGSNSIPGYLSAMQYNKGVYQTLRPFWVARVSTRTWEVTNEYPYPGFRGNWILIDNNKEHLYVNAGATSHASKIRLSDGEIVWTTPTGTGPYGMSLNADESELWVADKGETTGMFGRTITIIKTDSGRQFKTAFSGYQVDHVLLAPNGKEFWATSNGEGRIYVFDASTAEQTHIIDIPSSGDPHGLAWVHYDENSVSRSVRDQGGFHGGINPVEGSVLDYPVIASAPVVSSPAPVSSQEPIVEEEEGILDTILGIFSN